MARKPNLAPQQQPTVVVVGGVSPTNTSESSEPDLSDSTRGEERQEAIQLGAVLESNRQLSDQTAQDRMRIESLEASNAELRAANSTLDSKVSALLSAVEEKPETPDVVAVAPVVGEEKEEEKEPERPGWWSRMADWVNGA